MMRLSFSETFERFLDQQRNEATGMRRELLERDITGTRKLCEMLWTVFGTLDDFVLEYELVSETGVKIYADVFHRILRIVFEAEGYVVHAEKITRERHSFEQMRVRSFVKHGIKYMPFSWDELDKKPEMCARSVYELLGQYGNPASVQWMDLPVYEREIIRCAAVHPGPFSIADACQWLQLGAGPTRQVLRNLVSKNLLLPEGGGAQRFHKLRLSEEAASRP